MLIMTVKATARNVGAAAQSIKAGKWERSKLVGVEVKGKTLGVLGLGKGIIYLHVNSGVLLIDS
jgi:D-3-phosphoglycerate dehydrogenase / 2-oxoglutarate reductase